MHIPVERQHISKRDSDKQRVCSLTIPWICFILTLLHLCICNCFYLEWPCTISSLHLPNAYPSLHPLRFSPAIVPSGKPSRSSQEALYYTSVMTWYIHMLQNVYFAAIVKASFTSHSYHFAVVVMVSSSWFPSKYSVYRLYSFLWRVFTFSFSL